MFKRIIASVAIIIVLLGGGYYYVHNHQTSAKKNTPIKNETKQINVTLKINDGSKTTSSKSNVKENSTVLELMKTAQNQKKLVYTSKDSAYGVFIDSISNIKNDDMIKKYWTLYINGKMASEGAGTQKIVSGDTVEWRYEAISM